MSKEYVVALVGNPNCGKTTLFNALTGARQKVGNWPGVTVEKKSGHFRHGDSNYEIVDLPGTYALHLGNQHESLDEQIAQNFVLSGKPDLLLNIIDASSLERGLYLSLQLLDAGIPMVIALNMMDVADSHGMHIDTHELSNTFGFPFVPLVASKSEGLGPLKDAIESMIAKPRCQVVTGDFPAPLEHAIDKLSELIKKIKGETISPRLLASALLERDSSALTHIPQEYHCEVEAVVRQTEQAMELPLIDEMTTARYHWIHTHLSGAINYGGAKRRTASDYLDDVLLNRFLAIPLFLLVMYLMFLFTINFGSAFIDFFDIVFGAVFVELPRSWMTALAWPDWLITIIADGLGGGIQLVSTFIPVIGTLFFFLSFLEDSGYMARAAFIIDRMMRSIGLPGKSFVPLIIGFGCNVPSVMAARTLENQNDRLLTTIMAPCMSCGARLTVYALFAAAFFPVNGQNIVFGLYIIGVLAAVVSAFVIRRFIMSGTQSPFIIELPPYHIPTLKGLLILSWQRLRGFMLRAGKAIVIVVVALSFVNSIGTDGSFGHQDSKQSMLSHIGQKITPIFAPMGMKEDNWPAAVGLFTGMFAKEVVVGTLDTLYTDMIDQGDAGAADDFDLAGRLLEGWQSIPDNLVGLMESLGDPLGINIGDVSDAMTAAKTQEVEVTTISLMQKLFDGQIAAFAYLLFILLYIPCVATLGAIYKEQGQFWMWFTVAWSLVMGYTLAVIVYQLGTFAQHPQESLLWVISMLMVLVFCYTVLLRFGKLQIRSADIIPAVNI
jgi:ferrous iron transport protein B